MAGETGDYGHSGRIEHHLKVLREDCSRAKGTPFEHFLCPILLEDQRVNLSMGHIINEACPNSVRECVVQRKDVDNFYGSLVEADFTSNVQALSMGPHDASLNPEMSKKLRPRIIVNGEEWKHYQDRGVEVPRHSKIALQIGEGEPLHLVVKKTPEEIDALEEIGFELRIGKDCRLAALVSLIKAAYLTLFKFLGYSYALSADGKKIGYETLGKFYREHGDKKTVEARKQALDFFRPYVNMMRTIEGFTGKKPLGTIEDHCAKVCITPSGKILGMVVCIRTNTHYYDVLMPYFEEAEGEAAYDEFMRNDSQSLRVHTCQFETERVGLIISQQSREIVWPKNDKEFRFE